MRVRGFLLLVLSLVLTVSLVPTTARADGATVVIQGKPEAGLWVIALASGVDGELTYEWFLDGVPTPSMHPQDTSEPSPWPDRFFLREEHVGSEISVAVTGAGAFVASEPLVIVTGTVLHNRPVIRGNLVEGETVTVEHNVLYPLDAEITYQWIFNGSLRGTAPTFTLPALTNPSGVYVIVTARKAGWKTSVAQSSWVGERVAQIPRGPGNGMLSHGQIAVGFPVRLHRLKALESSGEAVQWVREHPEGGETRIPGATGWSYRMTADDIGHTLRADVTASTNGLETQRWSAWLPNRVAFNVYTTPGEHTVNHRQWRTTCEPYSQTVRCRTEIWATVVVREGNRFEQRHGWAFNNLTYLPLGGTQDWNGNRLATNTSWTGADQRQWRTECDTEATGRNTCRTYATAHVNSAEWTGMEWRYTTTKQWVFNNILHKR